jgi:3-methyladenine DNA glycosylase AlkD
MNVNEVMKELKAMGNEQTKTIFSRHGAKDPHYGVKVQDLKKILKKTKTNHELALQLWDTGNSDAMYLAGLMADEKQVTKKELKKWVKDAYWYMLSEYSVAGLASESPLGMELGQEWIKSKNEMIAAAGWATLAGVISLREDKELDEKKISQWLDHIEKNIHQSQNRVKYTMNGFVISVAAYFKKLSPKARKIADKIGKVNVNVGVTACNVPFAPEYILKMEKRPNFGKKRTYVRC